MASDDSEDTSIARALRGLADRVAAQERLTERERAELRWFREFWSRSSVVGTPIEPAKTALPGGSFTVAFTHGDPALDPNLARAKLTREMLKTIEDLRAEIAALQRRVSGTRTTSAGRHNVHGYLPEPHTDCTDPAACDCECTPCKRIWSQAGRPVPTKPDGS